MRLKKKINNNNNFSAEKKVIHSFRIMNEKDRQIKARKL